MWDLDTLRYLNEKAYLNAQKLVNDEVDQPAEAKNEPVFPLAILASKLTVGPPLLSRLIDFLENSDSVVYFIELVREYLPEHEAEILSQIDDVSRIRCFHRHFGNRYFPLEDAGTIYDDIEISEFVHHIPVELMGFAYDDYEEFSSFRDGFVLLLSILESPFEESGRVPILERVKELVGKGLLELIPPDGWSLDDVHRMLDGTEYEGCAVFADWVFSNTGCWQLDGNYTEYGPEEWDREIVDGLTRQWPEVVDIQTKMHKAFDWLEEDLYHNFEKLLSAMIGVECEEISKEQIPFPLDDKGQVIRKEVKRGAIDEGNQGQVQAGR